jgi:type II secretory pathway pseudopilin PulG
MQSRCTFLGLLSLVLLPTIAAAQTWSAEQQEVWALEQQQWQMSKDKDLSWIEKMVHPNISYWDVDQPGPQNRASLTRWSRYGSSASTVLEQELFPIAVTITGNLAVAQYRYVVVREDYKKERETATGRYTDVLMKEGDRWLFIAWAGGDDAED